MRARPVKSRIAAQLEGMLKWGTRTLTKMSQRRMASGEAGVVDEEAEDFAEDSFEPLHAVS